MLEKPCRADNVLKNLEKTVEKCLKIRICSPLLMACYVNVFNGLADGGKPLEKSVEKSDGE